MTKYILKRLGLMVVTFVILIFLIFFFIRLMPDFHQTGFNADPEIRKWWIETEGINRPIFEQFIKWVSNIFKKGDFGYSFVRQRDVLEVLKQRLPETIKINLIPFFISVPLGITLGIIAALRKNKLSDHIISVGVMILISIPSFVIAVLLQYLFVYKLKWLPSIYVFPKDEALLDPVGNILSRVLPTVVLSAGMIAGWTRTLRAELTEVLTAEFMLLARAKGLTKSQATFRHALRNAFVPFAPAIIGGFVSLLSGSLIIETTFRIAGVGGLYLQAVGGADGLPDYPMVMIISSFYLLIGLLTGIVADLSYGIIDPRIKMGAGKQ